MDSLGETPSNNDGNVENLEVYACLWEELMGNITFELPTEPSGASEIVDSVPSPHVDRSEQPTGPVPSSSSSESYDSDDDYSYEQMMADDEQDYLDHLDELAYYEDHGSEDEDPMGSIERRDSFESQDGGDWALIKLLNIIKFKNMCVDEGD